MQAPYPALLSHPLLRCGPDAAEAVGAVLENAACTSCIRPHSSIQQQPSHLHVHNHMARSRQASGVRLSWGCPAVQKLAGSPQRLWQQRQSRSLHQLHWTAQQHSAPGSYLHACDPMASSRHEAEPGLPCSAGAGGEPAVPVLGVLGGGGRAVCLLLRHALVMVHLLPWACRSSRVGVKLQLHC